jgi:NAD-dependent DNA ligase
MNIQALGDKIIKYLFEHNYISNIADLYNLDISSIADLKIVTTLTEKEANKLYENIQARKKTEHQVVKKLLLDGIDIYSTTIEQLMSVDFEKAIGDKTAKKIIDNIEDSKNAPFHRVLFALGIRFVGETTAKYLAEHFRSLDAIRQATREQLTEAEEVGGKIADAIIDYFVDKNNIAIIENLRIAGLQFEAEEKAKTSDVLAGLTFVISGSFTNHSRDELKTLIEAHGGKNLAAVSATTSYLLAGDKIGPAKLQKANKLGINIIQILGRFFRNLGIGTGIAVSKALCQTIQYRTILILVLLIHL